MSDAVRTFETRSEEETLAAGAALAQATAPGDVVSLSGDLGAGKTVLVRGIADGLDVPGTVTSPTFNILVVHGGETVLNHFDLYRLERAGELEDIDFWGVLESGGVSVIEWGDRFPDALPPERLDVRITVGDGTRRFEVQGVGERGEMLARMWFDALRLARS